MMLVYALSAYIATVSIIGTPVVAFRGSSYRDGAATLESLVARVHFCVVNLSAAIDYRLPHVYLYYGWHILEGRSRPYTVTMIYRDTAVTNNATMCDLPHVTYVTLTHWHVIDFNIHHQ
jgi:hypothetical protein